MKKRILLFSIIISVLACFFAISISAAEIDANYLEFMTSGMLTVELEDGSTCQLYDEDGKALTWYQKDGALASARVEDLVYGFNGTELYSISLADGTMLAGTAQQGIAVVVNLRGVKNSNGDDITDFLNDNMFKENSPLQHIFMPDTIVHMNTYAFGFRQGSLSHLIGCYFSKNSQLKTISDRMFWNCKNLKYFNMPLGVTSIGVSAFFGCENIGEMYIPSGVTSLGHEGSNNSCFGNNKKMYFVNTPGEPKPEIYYLPENVKEIKGEIFKGCSNLNNVIVFNKYITSIDEDYAFNATNAITLVFLGDVVGLNTQSNKQWKTLKAIYFCNENDVDMSSFTTIQSNIASKFVFCNAEGNKDHLAEKTVTEPAKCELNAGEYTYCFCGYEISKVAQEGTALEHNLDYLNGGATLVSVTYADLSKNGTKVVKCSLCQADKELSADKVFDYKGYSKNGKGGFCMGYIIDQAALKDYEAKNGEVNYGFVASANNNTPLDENGNQKDNVVKADLTGSTYTAVDFILTSEDWTSENVANAEITLNMYVIANGVVNYVTQNGYSKTAEAYKYSDIK